ncbi:MAG: DUF192 domain-containing protein [Patescibacteria group bacterium]
MFESLIILLAIWSMLFSPTEIRQHSVLPDLSEIKIGETVFKVEIADNDEERARGLSGRANLPEDQGLLFDFIVPSRPGFWMKEMNFPIDIVWLNENWKIVDLTENFTPESYPQIIFPKSAVKYVLEINAGLIKKSGFTVKVAP